jgi:hypothetical protein
MTTLLLRVDPSNVSTYAALKHGTEEKTPKDWKQCMGILGLLPGITRIEHQSNTDIGKKITANNVNGETEVPKEFAATYRE